MNVNESDSLERLCGHLPAAVRVKVARLTVEAEAAWAGMMHVQDQANDAMQRWREAETNARRVHHFSSKIGDDGRPVYHSDAEGWMATVEPRLQAYFDASNRAKVNLPSLSAKWEAYSFLTEIKNWLTRGEEMNRRFKKHVPVKAKGQDNIGAVEKLRAQIADVDGRIEGVEHAPATAAELIERASAEVERVASYGALRINATDRSAPAVDLDWSPGRQSGGNFGAHQLLWVFRDDIKLKLAGIIEAQVSKSDAMTDSDRTQELERLGEEKLQYERLEESYISAAEAMGQFIARRRDADPRAILEVTA